MFINITFRETQIYFKGYQVSGDFYFVLKLRPILEKKSKVYTSHGPKSDLQTQGTG